MRRGRGPKLALSLLTATLLAVGVFMVRDVRHTNEQTAEMAAGAVRGLDLVGELQYQIQEARRSVLYALTTDDSNLQVQYADQSRAADALVSQMLEAIARQGSPETRGAARRLQADWAAYLRVRDEVVASILEGSTPPAIERDLREGIPAFGKALEDVKEIKASYREQAERQKSEATASSRRSLVRLGLILFLSQVLALIAVRMVHRAELHALRRSEASLRESEAKFRNLADTVASAIFIREAGRVRYANQGAEELTGYTRAELTAMSFGQLVHPQDRSWVVERETAREQGGQAPARYEFRIVTKSGLERWVDFTSAPTHFEGSPAVLGTAFDVSNRMQVEAQLLQAQKMEAVGQLAGGIAHDFNNLLSVILGHGAQLRRRLPDSDPLCRRVDEIQKAGERAASLTRQLLAFSRKQILVPQVLDLGDVVKELSNMLHRLIGEDIAISTVFQPDAGKVKADRGQLEQVVVNLAVNARDAMSGGGKLILEVQNTDLDEAYCHDHPPARPGPYVMLAVSDTGIGMDEETRSRVFEPFFTTKDKGKGTGLGLSMVYGIVKQSGGYIWVYSERGLGTTFKIYLPRFAGAESVTHQPHEAPPSGGSETILLLEDDGALRELVHEVLQENGYAVLEAGSGDEAVRMVEAHGGAIDLLLTDVVMPGPSGREVAKGLAATQPEMKVLYMSGYTDDVVVRRGVLAEGTFFIQKPFTGEALARKVRDVLDSARARGASERNRPPA